MIIITLIAAFVSIMIPIFMLCKSKYPLSLSALCYYGLYMALINSAIVGYVSSIKNRRAMSMFMLGCSTNSLMVLFIQIICLIAFKDSLEK